jgi:acetyltransferase-like isoleucine patch superfamily enzyme
LIFWAEERIQVVGLGAVVVLGNESEAYCSVHAGVQEIWLTQPLACVDILGCTMTERIIRNLGNVDLDVITLLASISLPDEILNLTREFANLKIEVVSDLSTAITETLNEYSQAEVGNSFIVSANCYAETDLLDFFYFHREGQQKITRAFDHAGSLDMWVVNCKKLAGLGIENLLKKAGGCGSSYFVAGYVRRLEQARDIRKITTDSLHGQCAMRPSGEEIKPGIWADAGAVIDRRARIVAPAYIGRGVTVREDALVTRCSSIERNCYVDYGTVIENSSILANTRVGIWLDVLHAVVSGNKMQSLKHDVVLEIPDPAVMRWNGVVPTPRNDFAETRIAVNEFAVTRDEAPILVPHLKAEAPATPETWQLGANPIQG